jgi:hypothetical protein
MLLGSTPVGSAAVGSGGGETQLSVLCTIQVDGDGDMTPGGPAPSAVAAINVEDVILSVGWVGVEIAASRSEINFTVGN